MMYSTFAFPDELQFPVKAEAVPLLSTALPSI